MKKIIGALILTLATSVAHTQVSFSEIKFSQNFSSSTTVADYTGPASSANTTLFTNIGVTGSANNVTSAISNNALVFTRTAASGTAGFRVVRGNSTITVADAPFTVVKFQFDLKLNVTAAPGTTLATGLVFGLGDAGTLAYSGNSTDPTNADSWAWFSARIPSGAGSVYTLRNSAGTSGTTNLSYNTSYTISVFANASASSLTYINPAGTSSSVSAGAYDIWIDTTREFAGLASTNSTMLLDAFKINHTSGSTTLAMTATFDNILMSTIPEPSSFAMLTGLLALSHMTMRRKRRT